MIRESARKMTGYVKFRARFLLADREATKQCLDTLGEDEKSIYRCQ